MATDQRQAQPELRLVDAPPPPQDDEHDGAVGIKPARPNGVRQREPGEDDGPDYVTPGRRTAAEAKRPAKPPAFVPTLITLQDLASPPTETTILGGAIPLGKTTAFYGPTSIGKSAALAQLAFAVASGAESLWGLPLMPGGGAVLIYTAEDSLDDWKRKAATLAVAGGVNVVAAIERTWIIDKTEGVARLSELVSVSTKRDDFMVVRHQAQPTEEQDALIAAAKAVQAKLVIVETASRLVDEEDNAHFSALQSALGRIGRETGAAVAISHHVTKDAARNNDQSLEAARGGGALIANARNALALFPADDRQAAAVGAERGANFDPADLFVLVHTKSSSSKLKNPDVVLVACKGTLGRFFRRPEELALTPEERAVNTERQRERLEKEREQLQRLWNFVAQYRETQPYVTMTWCRDRCKEIGLPKHVVERVFNLAVAEERGVLVLWKSDGKGKSYRLGRDPSQSPPAEPIAGDSRLPPED